MVNIVVVGSLNMDLVVRTPHLPAPGETLLGRSFSTAPGGKGANQAVAAARLGGQVAMIGRVGGDDFGKALRANFQASGVNTDYLATDTGAPSGIAVIQVDDSGQNTIVVTAGTNRNLSRGDIDFAREMISHADALLAQLEVPLDTVTHALGLAHSAGILTVLNPSPARELSREVLALADLLVPNETEARMLTDIPVDDWASAEASARALVQRVARGVVITLGAKGAFALIDNIVRRVPAFRVQAVDATAAGDAFVAALTVACASGRAIDDALRDASAAGALTCTHLGAQPALPTRKELEAFLG